MCPVALGGMVVEPGDLVLGDGDGLVVVPFGRVEEVGAATEAKHASEDKALAAMRAGTLPDRGWVDETLRRLGCPTEAA